MLGPGSAAPNFSGTDIGGGGHFALSDHLGDVVCLALFAHWCPHCKDELSRLQNLWTRFQGHGVQMVAVHVDPDQAAAQTVLATFGITFPVVQDDAGSTIFNSYATGEDRIPQLYIIDRDQIIHHSVLGAESESIIEGHIRDAIYSRDPVDIEMVMDVSDSMNRAPSGGDSKLMMMKQASKLVIDFLHNHSQAGDRVGLVWFTDNASEYTSISGEKLVPVVSSWMDLKSRIDSQVTGNCTAMGAGLQTAFDALSTSTNRRFAILLTDGMQNIEPMVKAVGGHYEIIDSGGSLCGGHSSTAAHPGVDITTYNTSIHTIGVGITGSYGDLLSQMANETDGIYLSTNDPASDLDLIYFVDLCNCLAGGSPSIVHHNVGIFHPERCQSTERFWINRSVRKITAILSWEKSLPGSLAFWLRGPGGTLLDLYREMKLFDSYAMATVYLPAVLDGKKLPHVGEWQMIVRGETDGSASYHAMIIAEDPDIKFVFDRPKKLYKVGDTLPLRIQLKRRGRHIRQFKEILLEKAALAVPIPELLAEYKAPIIHNEETAAIKRSSNPLEKKLKALSLDPGFRRRLIPTRKTFSLREGALSCQIKRNKVILPVQLSEPGVNTFRISMNYDSKESGPISRVSMVSVHVDPGPVDLKRSGVKIVPLTKDKSRGVLIHITPRNSAGQLIGPGRSEELGILLGKRKARSKVEDLLDGSYRIEILPKKRQKLVGKSISLTYRKRPFWKGLVEE